MEEIIQDFAWKTRSENTLKTIDVCSKKADEEFQVALKVWYGARGLVVAIVMGFLIWELVKLPRPVEETVIYEEQIRSPSNKEHVPGVAVCVTQSGDIPKFDFAPRVGECIPSGGLSKYKMGGPTYSLSKVDWLDIQEYRIPIHGYEEDGHECVVFIGDRTKYAFESPQDCTLIQAEVPLKEGTYYMLPIHWEHIDHLRRNGVPKPDDGLEGTCIRHVNNTETTFPECEEITRAMRFHLESYKTTSGGYGGEKQKDSFIGFDITNDESFTYMGHHVLTENIQEYRYADQPTRKVFDIRQGPKTDETTWFAENSTLGRDGYVKITMYIKASTDVMTVVEVQELPLADKMVTMATRLGGIESVSFTLFWIICMILLSGLPCLGYQGLTPNFNLTPAEQRFFRQIKSHEEITKNQIRDEFDVAIDGYMKAHFQHLFKKRKTVMIKKDKIPLLNNANSSMEIDSSNADSRV